MKRLLPVIHVANVAQALAQVQVARDAGADGVWLINHSISSVELNHVFEATYKEHSDYWIGLNFLDLSPEEAMLAVDVRAQALWSDNAMAENIARAKNVRRLQQERPWGGLYFGGVAFKYQAPVIDVAAAAVNSLPYVDVVTTSGAGTGVAASLTKIATMRGVMGEAPLAIASGITPENVESYTPYVDYFLVATGISKDFYTLDPNRTKELADILHAR